MKVFVSVGRAATAKQQNFLEAFEGRLRANGLDPKTIGRNTFTSGQPLDRIKETMRECRGLVVLAFERTVVAAGSEYVVGEEAPVTIGERRLATPWHHIELAMASMLGLPVFVILEKGVHREGLLEDKYGWYVFETVLDARVFAGNELNGVLADWSKRLVETSPLALKPTELTIGGLVKALKPSHVWAVLMAIATLASGSFAFGAFSGRVVDGPPTISGPASPAGTSVGDPALAKNREIYLNLRKQGRNGVSPMQSGEAFYRGVHRERTIMMLSKLALDGALGEQRDSLLDQLREAPPAPPSPQDYALLNETLENDYREFLLDLQVAVAPSP